MCYILKNNYTAFSSVRHAGAREVSTVWARGTIGRFHYLLLNFSSRFGTLRHSRVGAPLASYALLNHAQYCVGCGFLLSDRWNFCRSLN